MSGMHPSRKAYVQDEEAEKIDLNDLPVDRDHAIPSTARVGIAPEKASAILSQMDRKKRAAAIPVPTDDARVRGRLRELGEPIILFGEGPGDRRDRLRELLYRKEEGSGVMNSIGSKDLDMIDAPDTPCSVDENPADDEEEFYTHGEPELLESRRDIARYSLPRAHIRVERQKLEAKVPLQKHIKHRRAIKEYLNGYQVLGSQIAGDRPISIARFSPDSKLVAAGSWNGSIQLLSVPTLEKISHLRGHADRIGGISWHPASTINLSLEAANLASGGGDGVVYLWSLTQDTPIATLSGHSARVARIDHHPGGRYLASASYDTSWRLWDIATQKELLLQEGHSREVYSVSFQDDGALIATGGLDSIGRVWDMRTGRTIMVLDGHIREITGLAWHPDSYRVASASGDASVKIWDVRMVRCTATIGAHKKLVSDIRFFRGDGKASSEMSSAGTYFVTGGFDGDVKIHSSDDWAFIKGLSAHSGNVTSIDVSQDGLYIVSSGNDRTCKLWSTEDIVC